MSATQNIAAAQSFLQRLDPEAEFFTLQTFDDGPAKRHALARVIPKADPSNGALERLARLNAQGAGVFVAVNETDGTGRQAHNITRVRSVFVDLDGAPLQPVLDAGLEPHIVVESSPGKWHCYWHVEDCPLDQFGVVQRALAQRFGGDPSVHDLPRVLRVPGFMHNKGDPYLSHVLDGAGFSGRPYQLQEIISKLGLDLEATAQAPARPAPNAEGKITPGQRRDHLFRMGRRMAKGGSSREAVAAALAAENEARCDPPLPKADVDYLVGRAFTARDAQDWQEARKPLPDVPDQAQEAPDWLDGVPPPAHPDDDPRVDVPLQDEEHPKGDSGPAWPEPLDSAALHGIAGEFVRMIEPNTEADPAAILTQFLVAFGALVGRGPHYRVEGDRHYANLYALLLGATAKGRKGTSWGRVREAFELVEDWKPHVSGLSSGEGLKWNVRDQQTAFEENKRGERVEKIVDDGVIDKRLLVIESEFASALRSVQRQGNTLSATVREGWDTGNLRTLTKHDPITATGAHICIVGHITADELRSELTATDTANGFANRFLFIAVRRSKLLPFGGAMTDEEAIHAFAVRLRDLAALARTRDRMTMTTTARQVWATVYPELSAGSEGMHGAVTARAEAQCVRLALIYALLDGADQIDRDHLLAALAVWQYCDETAKFVFGASLGDRTADEIMRRLRIAGDVGMTRNELRDAFSRHISAEKIGTALDMLRRKGRASCEMVATGGRPSELWRAAK